MACATRSSIELNAMLAGVANPMPSKFPDSEKIEELMPIRFPSESINAPPELPGLIAASV